MLQVKGSPAVFSWREGVQRWAFEERHKVSGV
jgi:hypothetical protein